MGESSGVNLPYVKTGVGTGAGDDIGGSAVQGKLGTGGMSLGGDCGEGGRDEGADAKALNDLNSSAGIGTTFHRAVSGVESGMLALESSTLWMALFMLSLAGRFLNWKRSLNGLDVGSTSAVDLEVEFASAVGLDVGTTSAGG